MNYKLIKSLLLLIALLGLLVSCNRNEPKEITISRLEKLMQDGDVKDVNLVINKRVVEVILTENALRKQRISSEEPENVSPFLIKEGPHHQITIFSPESFKDDFDKIKYSLEDDNPSKQLGVRITVREDFDSWLYTWGFFFLTVFTLPITYFLLVFVGLAMVMKGKFPQSNDKLTWSIIIIFVPILGFILFMMIGRKQMIK